MINPVVRGWTQYYGAFYRSALSILLTRINTYLVRWTRKKYKRLRAREKARAAWGTCHQAQSQTLRPLACHGPPDDQGGVAGAEWRETVTLRSVGDPAALPQDPCPEVVWSHLASLL